MKQIHFQQKKSPTRCFIFLVLLRCSASFTLRPLLSQFSINLPVKHSHIPHGQSQGKKQLQQQRRTRIQQAMTSNNNGPVSLKSAAVPLLDAGKAFARTGELMIDMTTAMDLYGGALSSVGANIRNAGDNIAQAAASCRFKTAHELVIDEIREASSALLECSTKLQQAVDEANTDKNGALATSIEQMIPHMKGCSTALEMAGAALLRRQPLSIFGRNFVAAGQEISSLASLLGTLPHHDNATIIANEAAQRCEYAAAQMILAGTNLCPAAEVTSKAPTSGKSWLKGGQ